MGATVSPKRFCQQDLGIYQKHLPGIFGIMRGKDFPLRTRLDNTYVVLDRRQDPVFPTCSLKKKIFFCVTDPLPSGEFKIFAVTKDLIDSPSSAKVLRVLTLLKDTTVAPKPVWLESIPKKNHTYIYIVYELFNRGCLADLIDDNAYVGGLLSSHLIGYKVLCALKECHDKGMIHRDLKTSNILIRELADDSLDVRLTDFETAFIKGEDSDVEATRLCGYALGISQEETDHYLRTGKLPPADFERDLRAFGSLLHELATKKPMPDFLSEEEASRLGIFHQEIFDLHSAKLKSAPSLLSIQRRMFTLLKRTFPDAPEVACLKLPDLTIPVFVSPDYSTSASNATASPTWAKPREQSFSCPVMELQPTVKKTGFLASLYRFCCCSKNALEKPPLEVQQKPRNQPLRL